MIFNKCILSLYVVYYLTFVFAVMNVNILTWKCIGILSSAFALSEILDRCNTDNTPITEHKF